MAKETGNIAARVEQLVRPTVEQMGLRLWDVRYEKEGSEWFLRIYIDRDTPLDTDTCELVSRAVDPLLDKADPIDQSYYLEVGSPGLGRRLLRPEHFAAVTGQKVMAYLIRKNQAGEREVTGVLQQQQGNVLQLQTQQGPVEIDLKDTSYVKLCDDEDLFAKK
ncbi:ribosome maturation factor RimP [Ruminococcaceae bacterium OttesenSCG-928-A16]|nr:ribosome maturation factor RimP [Ruminococcaceae bacterium OttesenSCG-928-A16]